MINILKKIPIIEILIILIINTIILAWEFMTLIFIGLSLEFSSSILLNNNYIPPVDVKFYTQVISETILILGLCIVTYLNVSTLSQNRFFIKTIYFFKNNHKALIILYTILLALSLSFWVSLSCPFELFIESLYCLTWGFLSSFACPLILLYSYWSLQEKITRKIPKSSIILNIIPIVIFFTLFLLFIGYILLTYLDYDKFNFNLYVNIPVILLTIPLLITDETKPIICWIKQKIFYAALTWLVLCYLIVVFVYNEWVMFYAVYLTVLFSLTLILSKPILRLKAKNTELRREAELLYKR